MTSLWELPPETEWWTFGVILAGLTLCLVLGEAIRKRQGGSSEFSRKFVHVSAGVLASFTPSFFSVPFLPILLAILFIMVNSFALRRGLLPGIHTIGRRSYGTVYFPIAFLFLVVVFWYREPAIISLSLLVLAFADAGAAIVGESLRSPAVYRLTSDQKSIEGSIAMAIISFVIILTGLLLLMDMKQIPMAYVVACAGVTAVLATACEAISSRGLDNVTIPLSTAFALSLFLIPQPQTDVQQVTIGVSLGIFVAVASYKTGLLTPSGSVATFLLAAVVFGLGGWQWIIPLVSFFVLSSLISKAGAIRKAEFQESRERTGGRDHNQVFANGGIGGVLALLWYWYPEADLYPVFVGSVAAVTADTWGTELGMLTGGRTVRLPYLNPVRPGSNGGVTFAGLSAGLAGSTVIAASALAWMSTDLVGWVLLAGMAGTLIDSILGGTVQADYRCPVCGSDTDQRVHCNNQPTALLHGWPWLGNHSVNWVCAATGAVVMYIVVL